MPQNVCMRKQSPSLLKVENQMKFFFLCPAVSAPYLTSSSLRLSCETESDAIDARCFYHTTLLAEHKNVKKSSYFRAESYLLFFSAKHIFFSVVHAAEVMRVLVAASNYSEDIELVCITDVLARAAINVTVASVTDSKHITLSRGTRMECDALITEVTASDFDAVLLPGGMPGAEILGKCEALKEIMHEIRSQNKLYGAICAAPAMALGPMGLLEGVETATSFPSFEDKMPSNVKYSQSAVVRSGNCLTSRGPGTAIFFGLAVVSILKSPELAEKLSSMLLVDKAAEMDDVRALK